MMLRALEAGCHEPRAPFHPYRHALTIAANLAIGQLPFPAWVKSAANGFVIGQAAWRALLIFNSIISYPNEKTFFQSFFMLMTVQFFFLASA